MRVRMLAQISGTRDGQDWPPAGTVIDLPDDEAAQHIAQRNAVAADQDDEDEPQDGEDGGEDPAEAETATAPPAEAAEPPAAETAEPAEAETRRGRGRPKLPRDADGTIVRG